jgi:hypothetical protein
MKFTCGLGFESAMARHEGERRATGVTVAAPMKKVWFSAVLIDVWLGSFQDIITSSYGDAFTDHMRTFDFPKAFF